MYEKCKICGKADSGLKTIYKCPDGSEFMCSACVVQMLIQKEGEKRSKKPSNRRGR